MRRLLIAFLAASWAGPASAQDAYVSASLTADIIRFNRSETVGGLDLSGSGEALGFGLRLGTPLGSIWGVELEYVRPAEIESNGSPEVIPLPQPRLTGSSLLDELLAGGVVPSPVIFPPISYRIRSTQRNSTLSAGVWARQEVSARVALVYTGGVGFHRTERELDFTYELVPVPTIPSLPIALPSPRVTNAITYAARPFAGMEGRVRMTDHVELVPGIRLHGLDGGVLVRPSVGLGWIF